MNSFDFIKCAEKQINEALNEKLEKDGVVSVEDISDIARDILGMSPRHNSKVYVVPDDYKVYTEPDEFYNLDKTLIWLDPDFRRAVDAVKKRYEA